MGTKFKFKMNWFKFIGRIVQGAHVWLIILNIYALTQIPDKFTNDSEVGFMLLVLLLIVFMICYNVYAIIMINDDIKEEEGR